MRRIPGPILIFLLILTAASSHLAAQERGDTVVSSPDTIRIKPADQTEVGIRRDTMAVKTDIRTTFLKTATDNEIKEHDWFTLLKKRRLDLNDTTVIYPKFLRFCLKVYKWGDRFFNSYDTAYVVGTGKKWKVRLLSDNWVDSYYLNPGKKMPIRMMSDIYCNLGAYIQFMAVSVGYSFDLSHAFGGKPTNHKKFSFGFSCARFNAEAHYWENTGGTYIRTFGNYRNGRIFKEKFPGATQKTIGASAYYLFNNRKFSLGAAYNFSRIQKKSAGSAIAGIKFDNIDVMMDFKQLPEKLLPYLTIDPETYIFHYNSIAAIGGYSFNWVCNRHLLFNITAMPGIGYTHAYGDSVEANAKLLAMTINGMMSLTYNLKDFFICTVATMEGNWYNSRRFSFFSSIENLQLSLGYRF